MFRFFHVCPFEGVLQIFALKVSHNIFCCEPFLIISCSTVSICFIIVYYSVFLWGWWCKYYYYLFFFPLSSRSPSVGVTSTMHALLFSPNILHTFLNTNMDTAEFQFSMTVLDPLNNFISFLLIFEAGMLCFGENAFCSVWGGSFYDTVFALSCVQGPTHGYRFPHCNVFYH